MHLTSGSLKFTHTHSACLNKKKKKSSLEIMTSNLRSQACCSCIHMQLIVVPLAASYSLASLLKVINFTSNIARSFLVAIE